jgi:hypothetical protein
MAPWPDIQPHIPFESSKFWNRGSGAITLEPQGGQMAANLKTEHTFDDLTGQLAYYATETARILKKNPKEVTFLEVYAHIAELTPYHT